MMEQMCDTNYKKYLKFLQFAGEWNDGTKEWWLNGKQYTEEEFNRATKNDVPEYTMEEAINLIGHEFKIKK